MANKILDITFDLETCDVTPTAAPLQLAAVAWDRTKKDAEGDPFLRDGKQLIAFNMRCDLTEAVMDGLTFSQNTIDFWSRQPRKTQQRVIGTESDIRLSPKELWYAFFDWCDSLKDETDSDHIVLWCQGQDFDIPMMKHCAAKYGLKMPFNQYSFRDCRTLAFEMALTTEDRIDEMFRYPKSAPYDYLPPIPEALQGYSHDALFDCIRSTWSVWHILNKIKNG